jgi:predicted 3-demethylubiquinone-9 3-methyltransferase (glyoxalase superfamily)
MPISYWKRIKDYGKEEECKWVDETYKVKWILTFKEWRQVECIKKSKRSHQQLSILKYL